MLIKFDKQLFSIAKIIMAECNYIDHSGALIRFFLVALSIGHLIECNFSVFNFFQFFFKGP